jgi:hypothetical protein
MTFRFQRALLVLVPLVLVASACGDGTCAPDEDCTGDVCTQEGATRACSVGEKAGAYYCGRSPSDDLVWSECLAESEIVCRPGAETWCYEGSDVDTPCVLNAKGVPVPDQKNCNDTPLVLKFGAAPVSFTSPVSAAPFDISGLARCASPDWPTSATPWLAIDLNHDGEIDGSELFGSGSVLADGHRASNGFLALAELDSNGDGHITPADARYAELLVWTDKNADRRATPAEIEPLSALGVVDIDLHYGTRKECDGRGNCGVERASFGFETGAGESRTGEVVDVHLACGDR